MAEAATQALLLDTESNPFPGLRPFEPQEHHLYFGRTEQTNELMSRLRGTRFLAVVGTSGSGKSSLVLAGLVPALQTGIMASAGSSWRIATMRPGGDAIGNLAAALASPDVIGESGDDEEIARSLIDAALRGSSCGLAQSVNVAAIPKQDNVLLVVDQFEELFRFRQSTCAQADREAAVAFVKLLVEAIKWPGRLYIVITMRSDFIGDCMEFPQLPEAINRGQYLVPKLTRDQLRQAITGPIGVAGGAISPRLVSRLLNEVGDELDQLPVMQHALMRMWDCWLINGRQGKIDLEHYKAIGTMSDALSIHAENPFEELREGRERDLAGRVFKTLTETEIRGRGVRRPARVSELCRISQATEEEIAQVIEPFRQPGRCFLMPPASMPLTAESIVDISHETLMRNWERLVEWTEEEATSARIYRRLSDAAAHHAAGDGGLWRDPEVELAKRWREANKPTAAWARRYDEHFDRAIAFLEKSDREQESEQLDQRQRIRNRQRRKRWFAVGSLVGALLIGFSSYIWQEARFLNAVTHALTVDDPAVRAQVLGEMPDPLKRKLRGLWWRNEPSPGGIGFDALRDATVSPVPLTTLHALEGTVVPDSSANGPPPGFALALSEDGSRLVTWGGAAGAAVRIWHADGHGAPLVLEATGAVMSAALRSGGSEVVTYSVEGEHGLVHVLSKAQSSRLLRKLPAGSGSKAAFSLDGSRLITFGGTDGTARIVSLDSDDDPIPLSGHSGRIRAASFSPDGDWVVTASVDKTARLWKTDGTGGRRYEMDSPVVDAAFHPLTGRFAAVDARRRVKLWESDGTFRMLGSSADGIMSIRFTADGRPITTTLDGGAQLWKLSGVYQVFRGLKKQPIRAAVSGDRFKGVQILATWETDGTVFVWPVEQGEPRRIPVKPNERVASFALRTDQDGTELDLATVLNEHVLLRHLRPSSPSVRKMLKDFEILKGHTEPVDALAWFPDGRLISASQTGSILVWENDENEWQSTPLGSHFGGVRRLAVSPDSTRVVTAGKRENTARIWRFEGGAWKEELVLWHDDEVRDASFDPDSNRIVTASGWKALVWSPGSDEPIRLEGHREHVIRAVFGPNGEIATASSDGTARIWKRPFGDRERFVELRGHQDEVSAVAFSSGGATLVTASKDGTARTWRVSDGKELYQLPHPSEQEVEAVALSADGSYGVTGHNGDSLLLWRLTARGLRDYLRNVNNECLPVEDRIRNLGEPRLWAEWKFHRCESERARGHEPTS